MVWRKRTEPDIMFKIKRIRVHLGGEFLYNQAFVQSSALGSCSFLSPSLNLCISEYKIHISLGLYRACFFASMFNQIALLKIECLFLNMYSTAFNWQCWTLPKTCNPRKQWWLNKSLYDKATQTQRPSKFPFLVT